MNEIEFLLSPFKNSCPGWGSAPSFNCGNVEGLFFEGLVKADGKSSERFSILPIWTQAMEFWI